MLDLAIKQEEKLKELFANVSLDMRYKFYYAVTYREQFKCSDSTWDKLEMVSLSSNKEIIGYISCYVNRETMVCSGLSIINFYSFDEDSLSKKAIFGRDVEEFINDLFVKYQFRKLKYCVIIGNPIEHTYDRLTSKYGGRIVGYEEEDAKLLDGNYYDIKNYEIFRDKYLEHKNLLSWNGVTNEVNK